MQKLIIASQEVRILSSSLNIFIETVLKNIHTMFPFQKSLTLPPCCQSPHLVGSFSQFVISSPVLGSVFTNTKSTNLSRGPTSMYRSEKNQ